MYQDYPENSNQIIILPQRVQHQRHTHVYEKKRRTYAISRRDIISTLLIWLCLTVLSSVSLATTLNGNSITVQFWIYGVFMLLSVSYQITMYSIHMCCMNHWLFKMVLHSLSYPFSVTIDDSQYNTTVVDTRFGKALICRRILVFIMLSCSIPFFQIIGQGSFRGYCACLVFGLWELLSWGLEIRLPCAYATGEHCPCNLREQICSDEYGKFIGDSDTSIKI